MITNHILEEKSRVQRELAKEAEYDLRKYMENVNRIVKDTEREYGVEFKYYSAKREKP